MIGVVLGFASDVLFNGVFFDTQVGVLATDLELFTDLTEPLNTNHDGSNTCGGRRLGGVLAGTPVDICTHGVTSTVTIRGTVSYSLMRAPLVSSRDRVTCGALAVGGRK